MFQLIRPGAQKVRNLPDLRPHTSNLPHLETDHGSHSNQHMDIT